MADEDRTWSRVQRNAVIGGAVGAAGGAVVAAQTASRDVVVARNTLVILVLTAPWRGGQP